MVADSGGVCIGRGDVNVRRRAQVRRRNGWVRRLVLRQSLHVTDKRTGREWSCMCIGRGDVSVRRHAQVRGRYGGVRRLVLRQPLHVVTDKT